MDSFMRVISGILCGVGGAGGISPIVYATASQSSFETLWRQVVDDSGPIISCDDSGGKYQVTVTMAKNNAEDMGSNLTLKVSMMKTRGNSWQEVWKKGGDASGTDVWSEWTLKLEGGKIERIQYKEVSRRGDLMVQKCEFKNGRLVVSGVKDGNKDIKAEEMKLRIDDCKGWIFSKKCSIKLSSGGDLSWGTVIVPTVTYYAF
ncbi:hypothetical protein WEN_01825 [Mycoplasma wenyonii str. Massachusetts]|uniref:Uncharacterized protein n=1 Tax=Mycoplasma wenyonii (strain Massachusetts) TaxID=1197325 RepID=I6Z6E5_MYCWM|nr:hypothetical protein [Mycoplasma wenyonii]AFN65158.1 hypothetical protein WEN_01825 [Mycoplasma wenyonii str. Massachusetts]